MSPYDRRLLAAQGYLDLGLPSEAHEELEEIVPEMRHLSEVLALKVTIFEVLQKWALLEVCAKALSERQPDEPRWFLAWATAVRHERSLKDGLEILVRAATRFPEEAQVFYRLACYQVELGYLNAARGRLADAIRLDAAYAKMASHDPVFQVLQGGAP